MYFEKKRRNQESNFPAGAEDVLCDVDIMKTGPIQKNRTGYHPMGSTESCLLGLRAQNNDLAQYREHNKQNAAKAQTQRAESKEWALPRQCPVQTG